MDKGDITLMWIGGIYVVGFILTLLVLIKYGKSKFGIDYDKPKTYVNMEDYDSNTQAFIWFSIMWIIIIPITLIFIGFNKLEKLVQKEINKNKESDG